MTSFGNRIEIDVPVKSDETRSERDFIGVDEFAGRETRRAKHARSKIVR